ncbi:MAG: hypothetical protein V1903_14540 [Bacteroidota bacterium]
MKRSNIYILLSLFVIFSVSGCKKRDLTAGSEQKILFQYDYTNGSQHSGYLIDNEGNVFTYNDPSFWNMPDNDLELSQEQLTENTGNSVFSGVKIPEDELSRYAKVIEFIASSKVSGPGKNITGKGTAQYICYQFDENSQRYRGHLIRSEGNVTRENLNFHSKRITQWMKEIGTSVMSE